MSRFRTLALAACLLLGLALGCQQRTSPGLAALEGRVNRLESDLRAAEQARDLALGRESAADLKLRDLSAKFAELTLRMGGLSKERDALVRERDGLAQTLTARTGERDHAAGQLDSFTKDLRTLLARVESAGAPALPVTRGPGAEGALTGLSK